MATLKEELRSMDWLPRFLRLPVPKREAYKIKEPTVELRRVYERFKENERKREAYRKSA